MNLSEKEVIELKRKARFRTSKENEKLNPLNMSLKDLGYTREKSYALGFEDCEIIYSRTILDLIGIRQNNKQQRELLLTFANFKDQWEHDNNNMDSNEIIVNEFVKTFKDDI